jgi:hypothetical protein
MILEKLLASEDSEMVNKLYEQLLSENNEYRQAHGVAERRDDIRNIMVTPSEQLQYAQCKETMFGYAVCKHWEHPVGESWFDQCFVDHKDAQKLCEDLVTRAKKYLKGADFIIFPPLLTRAYRKQILHFNISPLGCEKSYEGGGNAFVYLAANGPVVLVTAAALDAQTQNQLKEVIRTLYAQHGITERTLLETLLIQKRMLVNPLK